ncbi:MAG: hypothetical protein KatS3mg086_180 [Candidatus Dojkabacteria bacterium]|nr:MAG: hypothetical protein KatS3mg086_180 [Candidatus Dojkabacteria bacterium]
MDPDLLPQLKPEITFAKVVTILVTITLFFALPAWLIETYIAPQPFNQQTQGQVAGITTDDSSNISNNTNLPIGSIDINSIQPQVFIVAGIILIGIALIVLLFLIFDQQRRKTS